MSFSNVPEPLNLEIRQGSDFGEIRLEVEGIDLTKCEVQVGVVGQVLAPVARVVDSTTISVEFPAALTEVMRSTQSPLSDWGTHRWWVDLVSKADGKVEPLALGRVKVIERGFQGA